MLPKISLRDMAFGPTRPNPYIDWNKTNVCNPICVYTDRFLEENHNDVKYKVAWLIEPPCIYGGVHYEYIRKHPYKFDLIFTYYDPLFYDPAMKAVKDRIRQYYFGGCWVPKEECQIYGKLEMTSIVVSNKRESDGHQFRHHIVDKHKDKLRVMGRAYWPFKDKIDAHKPFRYSVVVENQKTDYWFTEKLLDCIACGCIPIYYGCPRIGDFFDTTGIIQFDSMAELTRILNDVVSEEDYEKRLPAAKANLEKIEEYRYPEMWLLKNGLGKLCNG